MTDNKQNVTRRQFLFQLAAGGAGAMFLSQHALGQSEQLRAVKVDNPLTNYPNRGWEKVYRNLYKTDSSFTFLCAPNDTHNCLMRAHVKNGVAIRISPTYGYSEATDLSGNKASRRWDPRCCQKGLALVRRFYGDRRCKRPLVRRGFRQWVNGNFPRDPVTGAVDKKYLNRGRDPWEKVTWEEAFDLAAKAIHNIATTYSGEEGQKKLLAQGYDPLMVKKTGGAGTQVLKFRGGMPPLGMTRVFAQYRLANSMALLDTKIRGTNAKTAVGARGWDNYSWHTDLPPGHPMVTGQQTVDWDLCNVEHANLVLVWGMNWITTKMPDAHWLTEARMKGTRVVVISAEYSATANKGDQVMVVRPGTTPALSLGFAQVIMSEKLYDDEYVKTRTDLPFLIRLDTGKLLRAKEVFPGYQNAKLENNTIVTQPGQKGPAIHKQPGPVISQKQRDDWGDHVFWDERKKGPVAVNRDQHAHKFPKEHRPALLGTYTVKLADGKSVKCRTVFDITKEVCDASYTPEDVEKLTWAPAEAVRSVAHQIAQNKGKTLFAMGMGPNQYFNNDLKDRNVFLVAALTGNVGRIGGNVGSYAGNYRASFFNGLPQYIGENPFDIELDPKKPARSKKYWKAESVHYWNHGDKILRMGGKNLTGDSHMPTPTKSICVSNSNSLIGNAKGHYETVVNGLPKVEFIGINEWWWTASCEYSDIVFAVDSWGEFRYPDMTISVTNPFLYVFPTSPLKRIHDTRSDMDVAAGVPAIMQTRTYPKVGAWEQGTEGKPYYTKTGRLEFYREEPEFIDSGENVVVHREPIDSTMYEPNVIVAKPHALLRPKTPQDYGVDPDDVSGETRQARHVVRSVAEVLASKHPLRKLGYKFIFHTPKFRHGAHTTPVDTDIVAIWFGPFGDMHRHDKRMPFVTEAYVDINPFDAKELGVEDGDYVYIDADPHDRPFHGWEKDPAAYKVARLLCRARYYPGTPRGITRMWHNMYGSTFGSVKGAETNPTGLAKSPDTGYQSLFRTGSHQSCTRGYLKPTWMTDTLYVKGLLGQQVTQGFVPDVHCPTGAPREAFVKITRAEAGGLNGEGLWRVAKTGMRPTYEHKRLKDFIAGKYVQRS